MNDCAVVIAPNWEKGGSNNIFAAQCEYYRSKNWEVLLAFPPNLARRRDLRSSSRRGPPKTELQADFVTTLYLGNFTRQIRYLISRRYFRNHPDGVLHRNFMSRACDLDEGARAFLRGKTIREICVNWCDNVDAALALRRSLDQPEARIVLHTHDIVADHTSPREKRTPEIRKLELEWVSKADYLVHVSEDDAAYFAQALRRPQTVSYITLEPRLERELGKFAYRPRPRTILYVGSWNAANPASMDWFFKQVLPFIERDVNIFIAGDICRYIRYNLAEYYSRSTNIHLLDRVDGVAEYYERAGVVMLPTVGGTGASVKLIEALAMGVPTVMNSLAARGLPAKVKEMLRPTIADGPIEFAERLNDVLGGSRPEIDLRRVYWDNFSNKVWFGRLEAGEEGSSALA